MFIMVFSNNSPILYLIPVITIDPVTDSNVDDNNYLMLSGKTNLQQQTTLSLDISPSGVDRTSDSDPPKQALKGDISITGTKGGWTLWNGTINLSPLELGEYLAQIKSLRYTDNFTKRIESGPINTLHFTVGNKSCREGCLRKRVAIIKPFIRINPDQEEQKNVYLTGITSLAPGSYLDWKIEGDKSPSGSLVFQGKTLVYPGLDGVNRWAVIPGNESIIPDKYTLTVTSHIRGERENIHSNEISDLREFNYSRSNLEPIQGRNATFSLKIDALPQMKVNNKYLISGSTNLPPGERLFFEVTQPKLRDNYYFSINPKDKSELGYFSGIAGCILVQNGSGKENLWTIEMETYFMTAGPYEVNVSNMTPDQISIPVKQGTVSDSEEFILEG